MNFSAIQWIVSYYLDVVIKCVLMSFIGLLVTLGGASVEGFLVAAILLSMFHFLCLLLACMVVEPVRLRWPNTPAFALTLIVVNIAFALSFAALFGLGHSPGETLPGFGGELIVGSVLATTNFLPLLIVAACSRLLRRT
jgi:hypothetical protein